MKIFEKINSLVIIVASIAMMAMVLQVSLDIILKYLFNFPIPTTLETVSSYYMVALVFLPLGFVTKNHEHISVELFTQGMSVRNLSLVNAVAGLLCVAYVISLAYFSFSEAVHMTRIREEWETAVWDMEVWPSRWFVPIGCTLMLFYLVVHVIDNFTFFLSGKTVFDSLKGRSKLDLDL